MTSDCGYSYGPDAWLRACYTPLVYVTFDNITANVESGLMSVNGATSAAGMVSHHSCLPCAVPLNFQCHLFLKCVTGIDVGEK